MARRQQKKIKHVPLFPNRNKFSRLERIFTEKWAKECEPCHYINHGYGLLQNLLMVPDRKRGYLAQLSWRFGFKPAFVIHQRDATIAATIVQWLGTNCGFAFLCEALKADGWDIRPVPGRQTPEEERFRWDRKPNVLPGLTRLALEIKQITYTKEIYGVSIFAYKDHETGKMLYRPNTITRLKQGGGYADYTACELAKEMKRRSSTRIVHGSMWT